MQESLEEAFSARSTAEEAAALLKEELLTASEQLQQAEAAAADEAQRVERALEQSAACTARPSHSRRLPSRTPKLPRPSCSRHCRGHQGLIEPAQERAERAEEDLEAAQAALHDALAAQGHLQVLLTCKKPFLYMQMSEALSMSLLPGCMRQHTRNGMCTVSMRSRGMPVI